MGLRCWDVSCGLGPTDDDPTPSVDASSIRQVGIRVPGENESSLVCAHRFHPSCLVSAERVAGWGGNGLMNDGEEEVDKATKGKEKEKERVVDVEVEVSCPVCRAVGWIRKSEWDDGVCALA